MQLNSSRAALALLCVPRVLFSVSVGPGLHTETKCRGRCLRAIGCKIALPGTEQGFFLGPSLIDSSFQALMALADPAVGIGSLKIPLSIKRPVKTSPRQ